METYQALILGILQGFTEFLPVSSSGHLAIGQYIFGIKEPTLFFDITLHIGSLLAVIIIFFRDIKYLFTAFIHFFYPIPQSNTDIDSIITYKKLIFLIIIGSIPTALIGLFLKQYVEILFSSINFVGTMLIITGTFLWLTKDIKYSGYEKNSSNGNGSSIVKLKYKTSIFIGICQGIAVLPGISRSGSTIAAALFVGVERETAAKFSFLLSIPAIIGAELLGLKDIFDSSCGVSININIFYGTLASFISGYIALKALLKIVKTGKLYLFAPYCFILGVIAVVAGVL